MIDEDRARWQGGQARRPVAPNRDDAVHQAAEALALGGGQPELDADAAGGRAVGPHIEEVDQPDDLPFEPLGPAELVVQRHAQDETAADRLHLCGLDERPFRAEVADDGGAGVLARGGDGGAEIGHRARRAPSIRGGGRRCHAPPVPPSSHVQHEPSAAVSQGVPGGACCRTLSFDTPGAP